MPEKDETLKLADDSLVMIRELVQLAILTGTSILDHLRGLQLVVDPDTGKLIPHEDYVEAYNAMVDELNDKARRLAEEHHAAQQQVIREASVNDDDDSGFNQVITENDDNLN